jgi:hypothetical protein
MERLLRCRFLDVLPESLILPRITSRCARLRKGDFATSRRSRLEPAAGIPLCGIFQADKRFCGE